MWNNKALGDEVQLLSHVCVNGSFAHLSIDEWNQRCFSFQQRKPYLEQNHWILVTDQFPTWSYNKSFDLACDSLCKVQAQIRFSSYFLEKWCLDSSFGIMWASVLPRIPPSLLCAILGFPLPTRYRNMVLYHFICFDDSYIHKWLASCCYCRCDQGYCRQMAKQVDRFLR